jgi:hypothetical protein
MNERQEGVSTLRMEQKDITLRGVDKELYDQFVILAKKRGSSTGTAFSHIISWNLRQKDFSPGSLVRRPMHKSRQKPEIIQDIEKLVVSKDDLVAAGDKTMFLFKDIGRLIFDESVDKEILLQHVKVIIDSKVEFRNNISKVIHLRDKRIFFSSVLIQAE